jgi:hypothetical protein
LVKADTLVGRQRKGFRIDWAKVSQRKRYRRAPRIHGQLLKLGIAISERTVSRLIPKNRNPPSQTWRAFLNNHVKQDLVSVDLRQFHRTSEFRWLNARGLRRIFSER